MERESDAWTGFTRFIVLKEKPPVTRKQTTSRPDNVWPDMWKHMSDAAKRKAKQKWTIEKPMLDNVRQSRGIFFIEQDDEDFKNIMKKRSWKFGNSDASSNALQNTNKQRWRNLLRYWEKQDKTCLYCRS